MPERAAGGRCITGSIEATNRGRQLRQVVGGGGKSKYKPETSSQGWVGAAGNHTRTVPLVVPLARSPTPEGDKILVAAPMSLHPRGKAQRWSQQSHCRFHLERRVHCCNLDGTNPHQAAHEIQTSGLAAGGRPELLRVHTSQKHDGAYTRSNNCRITSDGGFSGAGRERHYPEWARGSSVQGSSSSIPRSPSRCTEGIGGYGIAH